MKITIPITREIIDGLAAGTTMATGADEVAMPGGVLQIELLPVDDQASDEIEIDFRYPLEPPEAVKVGDHRDVNEQLRKLAEDGGARVDYPIAEPARTGMEAD